MADHHADYPVHSRSHLQKTLPVSRKLAVFDFDGTLTRHDSLIPFLHAVRGSVRLGYGMMKSLPWLVGYALKCIPNDTAKQRLLRYTLGGLPLDRLQEAGRAFAHNRIPTMLRPDMMARLRQHQAQGDDCILLSASLDLYLVPWARMVGFHNVLCSSLEMNKKQRVTGQLKGNNCYGTEKVRRIKEYISRPGCCYGYITAYGDSSGDIPLLKFSDEGYMVKNKINKTN
nr:HAD family hydrolase [Komagataeibacter sp. FXV3]